MTFICTFTPKQHGHYPVKLKRGHAQVNFDGKGWAYHVPKGERRAFRRFLEAAFSQRGYGLASVTGCYPV